MGLLTPEVEAFIGVESEAEVACDPVERGAVRRYAQATMDDDPIYYREPAEIGERTGRPVAPLLFPMYMFRRDFGTPDPMQERAEDPDFDGIVGSTAQGLPPLPLPAGISLLNAGTEVEFFRHAEHGERIRSRSRYDRIFEKQGCSGPMLFVVIQTDYLTESGEMLVRVRKTQIRR